jgi:cytochrome c peroxidase
MNRDRAYRFAVPSVLAALLASVFGLLSTAAATDFPSYQRPATIPAPVNNLPTPERIELGRALFFDPRLSGSNWISCASCHNPSMGWSDGLPTMVGHNMKVGLRKTPSITNIAYSKVFMWDGRFRTLEAQALGPIGSDAEMNQNVGDLVSELHRIRGYVEMFKKAYPGEMFSTTTIGKALAAYQRTIVSGDAPFDRWIKGDKAAISLSAKRGFVLFEGKADCVNCHHGFNFMDNGFHNIGVKSAPGVVDKGRYTHRMVKVNLGAFKTPTLRNVALHGPYMHNGSYTTLEEVVEHYNRGGDVKDNLDPNMKPGGLGLSKQEVADVVEFLKTLTEDRVSTAALPVLPR